MAADRISGEDVAADDGHGPAEDVVARAARNNAEWCSIVSGLHSDAGTFHRDVWASAVRTPDLYPDAVTLRRSVPADRLVGLVDAAAGCSIKDSFADVDLMPLGFRVLFEASWIHRPAPVPGDLPGSLKWRRVRDAEALGTWASAWRGEGDGPLPFRPGLLGRDDVVILGAYDDARLVGGAILNLAAGVVGVSNAFTVRAVEAEVFAGTVAASARWFPGLAIVGYETGRGLVAAEVAGFERVGRLRVWQRD